MSQRGNVKVEAQFFTLHAYSTDFYGLFYGIYVYNHVIFCKKKKDVKSLSVALHCIDLETSLPHILTRPICYTEYILYH